MKPYQAAVALGSSVVMLAIFVVVLPHVAASSDITPESFKQPVNPVSTEQPIYTIWGNFTRVHNNTEASSLAGFTVKFPRIVPDGDSLQLAVVKPMSDHKYGHVYLFYSKTQISNTTSLNDFEHAGGLLAEECKLCKLR